MKLPDIPVIDAPRLLNVPLDRRVRKPRATIVMLHGIGNTAAAWRKLEGELPSDMRLIAIDLLGFGGSPKPKGASYNVRVQARSVAATLLRLRVTGRVILVGHSLGALIAIELAKRYPFIVRALILCSPPIYRTPLEQQEKLFGAEKLLRDIFTRTANDAALRPDRYISLARTATMAKLASPAFYITPQTIGPYVAALRASIIQQSSYNDIQKLTPTIKIIYGTLDPFVVNKTLKFLAKLSPNITLKSVVASHEITKPYRKQIRRTIDELLN